MQYKISPQTQARVLDSFLSQTQIEGDKSANFDKLLKDVTELQQNINTDTFMLDFNTFINQYQISSLFAYENKFTGFFLKLDKTYDKERKVAILQQLENCLSDRKKYISTQFSPLAKKANELIGKIKKVDYFSTNILYNEIPNNLELVERTTKSYIDEIIRFSKGKNNPKPYSRQSNLKIRDLNGNTKKITNSNLKLAKKEWGILGNIARQLDLLIKEKERIDSAKIEITSHNKEIKYS